MKSHEVTRLTAQIRAWIIFMMVAIMLSGITAFPVETELAFLQPHQRQMPAAVGAWLRQVYIAMRDTNARYPFLAYGFDWLAFAHIVIALAFIGPLRHPVRNVWVIEWSMLCCFAVIPLALIAGPVRSIPMFHRIIDCCFGLLGLIPLVIVRRKIKRLAAYSRSNDERQQ